MRAVYVGGNPPGSSMFLIGQQISEDGVKFCTKVGELKGVEKVISLVPEDFPKLQAAQRFVGLGKIVNFLACNWEEFDLWTKGAILVQTTQTKLVVYSQYTVQGVMKTAGSLLSPATLRAIDRNLVYIPYGVSYEFSPKKKDPLKWIVPFNRVNETQKGINKHKELTTVLQTLTQVKSLFILIQAEEFKKNVSLDCYDVVPQPNSRDGYLQLIADRGAFLCTSHFESFGIYYLELLCSGCVGVFLSFPWIHLLLPEYPLIAQSDSQAIHMMKDVVNNYDYWFKKITEGWIPFIRQRYDLTKFVKAVWEV